MDTHDIPLKWYEQIHIRSYRKFCPDFPRNRILSIDWYKGFAIFWVTIVHLMATWADPWAWRLVYLCVDFVGPTTFLFFAGMNTTFSYRMGQASRIPQKILIFNIVQRMGGLFLIAIIWNLILGAFYHRYTDLFNIQTYFRWDVLQTIAVGIIIIIPTMNWSIKSRIIISFVIIVSSGYFFLYLNSIPQDIFLVRLVETLCFFPFQQSPLFPLVGIAMLGGVLIDLLIPYLQTRSEFSNLNHLHSNDVDCPPQLQLHRNLRFRNNPLLGLKISFGIAICMIFGGIFSGLNAPIESFYFGESSVILSNLYTSSAFVNRITFIPAFLITNTLPNIFFKLGIVVIIFTCAFYYFDIKHVEKKEISKITKQFVFMGEYTISYFIYAALFNLIPLQVDVALIWIPLFFAIAILTVFFKQLLKYCWGAGMIEWIINLFTLKLTRQPTIDEIRLAYPEKIRKMEESIIIQEKKSNK